MIIHPKIQRSSACAILALSLLLVGHAGSDRVHAAESVRDQAGAAAAAAERTVQQAGEATRAWSAELWRRVEEKSLQKRTPDQIMAWSIMGLVVAALIYRFGKLNLVMAVAVGLVGALLGGLLANLVRFDLGLAPVIIRYEELLAALVGGVLIFVAVRLMTRRKTAKT